MLRRAQDQLHLSEAAEQSAALDSLRESERRFSDMLGNVELVAVMLDRDARVTYCNGYLLRLTGWQHEEVIGRGWVEMFIPPESGGLKDRLAALLTDRLEARHGENTIVTRSGERRLIRWNNSLLRSAAGDVTGTASIGEDITEQRRGEEALRRFSTAMDATADAIYLVDRSSMRFVHVNEAACRMLSQTREELLARRPEEILAISRLELERDYDALIASDVDPMPLEMLRHRKNAPDAWIELRRRARRTVDGWTIVTLARDITERKHAEGEQRAMRQLLDNIIENIPTAVQVKSVLDDFRILMWNKAAEAMYGLPRGDAIGRNVHDLWPNADADSMHAADLDLLARGGMQDFPDRRVVTKDRGEIRAHMRKLALADAGGAATHLLVIADDITERRETEARIARLNRVHVVLSGINTAIVRIRERNELFREVCRIAVSEGGFTVARVIEVDASAKARIAATSEDDSRLFQRIVDEYNVDPERSRSLLAVALRSAQPLVSNDVADDPRIPNRAALTKQGTYAVALLPIIVEKRVAGAIILRARETGMFDQDELQLLVELTSNISYALEHIEKEAKVQRLTRVYAFLSGINSLIVRVHDRDELFREACQIAIDHGKFTMAWIGIVDRREMKLVPVASAGSTQDHLTLINQRFSLGIEAPLGNTFSAQAIRERKIAVSNDVQNDPLVLFKDEHAKRGSRSMAMLPLLVADEVAGILALYSSETGFFDEEELKLLAELASDIAFAIDSIDKQARLDYLAYYDALTGLANRTLLLERLAQYMRSAAIGGHDLALFFVDLERFKSINDSLGRPTGDALLMQVAKWMTLNAGDAGLVARVGADHFALILPVVKPDGGVVKLLEHTMTAFQEHPFRLDDNVFRVAAKVGVALYPKDGGDADTLLKHAEAALKKAKAGGERYLFFTSQMTETVAGNLTLENQLRQAIDREEFVLHYQPKMDLGSGRLTSVEALIRWNDPRTGLVPPGRFIPVLEDTGLIYDVGRWALRQAIENYLRWRNAGLPAVRIAVNVSPLQLRNRAFIAEIEQVLSVDARAAAGLELEITESLIMEDIKYSIATLSAIRAMGVTVAIDDFGTGFSSLSYLAKLPVDTLKIDRSFVVDMTVGPNGLALVSTIINLAHALKLKVVAEGVETDEQSRLLRLLHCDEMQGFLFSMPLPVDTFEARFLAPGGALPPATP